MLKRFILIFLAAFVCVSFDTHLAEVFTIKSATVSFLSKANFEKIRATSTSLKGTIDITKRSFSFSLLICSFEGFLNKLQKKHYCERYVEGDKFPTAAFKGKIIEEVDLSVPGTYLVRAKGMLLLHGVEKEMIITSNVIVKEDEMTITAKFPITLANHDMKLSKMSTIVIAKVVDAEIKISLGSN